MPEEKRKINCLIPASMYDKIEASDYKNVTEAVNEALERLMNDNQDDIECYKHEIEKYKHEIKGYMYSISEHEHEIQKHENDITKYKRSISEHKQEIEVYKHSITALQAENTKLKEDLAGYDKDLTGYKENIKALNVEITRLKEVLSNAPDPSELIEARTRIEGLQMVLEERNKRIEEINSHYENISSFANYFKSNEPKLLNPPAAEKNKRWWQFW